MTPEERIALARANFAAAQRVADEANAELADATAALDRILEALPKTEEPPAVTVQQWQASQLQMRLQRAARRSLKLH